MKTLAALLFGCMLMGCTVETRYPRYSEYPGPSYVYYRGAWVHHTVYERERSREFRHIR